MNEMKYAVVKTLGNSETVLRWFETRDEAVTYGREYFSGMNPGDGVLTIEGITNGDANRRIVFGWHF